MTRQTDEIITDFANAADRLAAIAGEEYFDRHRIGEYASGRRCMTTSEMRTAGFGIDVRGCWRVEHRAKRAASHWRKGKTRPVTTDLVPTQRVGGYSPQNGGAP